MCTVAEFISKNINQMQQLQRLRFLPSSVFSNYQIYKYYQTTSGIKSKMLRYSATSEAMRVSESTVRMAIREMEKRI